MIEEQSQSRVVCNQEIQTVRGCEAQVCHSSANFPRRLIVPRLRLREEVDVLKHLSQRSGTFRSSAGHPNVLGYIDSWEEDEALCIQTELCKSGNLAHFL